MAAVMVVMMVAALAFPGHQMMIEAHNSHTATQENAQSHRHGSESEKDL